MQARGLETGTEPELLANSEGLQFIGAGDATCKSKQCHLSSLHEFPEMFWNVL